MRTNRRELYFYLKQHKQQKSFIIFLFVFAFFISGCEDFFISEADNVDIPGSEPQLVVNSYISPQDSLIRVWVHRSMPYSQRPEDDVPVMGNADVFMGRKGEEFVQLHYNSNMYAFVMDSSQLAIEPNQYYVLKVETHDGDYAEAECFVPGFDVENIDYSSPEYTTDQWGTHVMYLDWNVKIKPGGGEKYFRTGGYRHVYWIDFTHEVPDTNVSRYRSLSVDRGTRFFTDDSGASYAFKGTAWDHRHMFFDPHTGQYPDMDNGNMEKIDSVFIYVLQSDYHYYQFHRSVDDYFYYDDDFPFAENVHIYSNIKGGLGTFGGFNKRDILITP